MLQTTLLVREVKESTKSDSVLAKAYSLMDRLIQGSECFIIDARTKAYKSVLIKIGGSSVPTSTIEQIAFSGFKLVRTKQQKGIYTLLFSIKKGELK